jgi:hypothetical protein
MLRPGPVGRWFVAAVILLVITIGAAVLYGLAGSHRTNTASQRPAPPVTTGQTRHEPVPPPAGGRTSAHEPLTPPISHQP